MQFHVPVVNGPREGGQGAVRVLSTRVEVAFRGENFGVVVESHAIGGDPAVMPGAVLVGDGEQLRRVVLGEPSEEVRESGFVSQRLQVGQLGHVLRLSSWFQLDRAACLPLVKAGASGG
ncbi:hypothetical protein GCM10010185_05710 [Saccharothrix coeruleofusca]|uniref:Uncharacterized protein n=1 Tax=Saccharothrix coeruleofusca TaxID=33919 RepID=A0A918AH86_9PSEU|nr:hypothetical protein GCM10010185_05710 [Saccharothrix coeruleofusca]